MELIRITRENLQKEHICCAIASDNDAQVMSKKAWLSDRLDEGLVFLKGNVRGKCFIEYIPAENAWAPIRADGYMYINCLWVAGQFKGHGYAAELLQACVDESKAQGKRGLVILSSKKKMGFLSDRKYMERHGFKTADTAAPYFELLYLPFDENAEKPRFQDTVKEARHEDLRHDFTLYYTNQCPFTAKYVPLLQAIAAGRNADLHTAHIRTREQAQSAPTPFTTFSLFYRGELITHEILSEKKFEAILADRGA